MTRLKRVGAFVSVIAALTASCSSKDPDPPATPSRQTVTVIPQLDESTTSVDNDQSSPPQMGIVISEVHYHPSDDEDAEFVEIANVGGEAISLDGWCIEGFGYCLDAETSLPPGASVTVDGSMASGRLSNGGERLELVDSAGMVVDAIDYGDAGQWPARADGHGLSLQRRNAASGGDSPGNWAAAEPTPDVVGDLYSTVLPAWIALEHTLSPTENQPIAVSAEVVDAAAARVEYVVGFGDFESIDAELSSDGCIAVEIPGQAAGELVRFRLIAEADDGTVGTWPREGDGSMWTGTVVASTGGTDLPRFQWFMEDDDYTAAFNDLTLTGDDGYPAVVAVDGRVFSDARVRVKGGSSRGWPKPKYKFILPAGHELSIDALIDEPVDEFGLHASWNDKTFAREWLAAQAFRGAGQRPSDTFPVQLELNGDFYGLYLYVEQPDGTWRDRHGFDDDLVYDVGASGPGFFASDELDLPTAEFRKRYAPETPIGDDDAALRELITVLNTTTGDERRDWMFANLDIPQILNFLAVSSIIQHQDFWSKNVRVMLDEHGRWSVTPHDLELTFGRRFSSEPCQSQCDSVGIDGSFDKPDNPLWGPFSTDPVLSSMLALRIERLVEQILDPVTVRRQLDEYVALIGDEAERDRAEWGTFGEALSVTDAIDLMYESFVVPQHERLTGPDAPDLVRNLPPVPPDARVNVSAFEVGNGVPAHVRLSNPTDVSLDVSGTVIPGCDLVVPDGSVVPAGGSTVVVSDDAEWTASSFDTFVAGFYDPENVDIDSCAETAIPSS